MKRLLLTSILGFAIISSFAQWNPNGATTGNIYYTGGNVGVGIEIPESRLHINNGTGQTLKFLTGTNTSGYALSLGVNDDGVNFLNNSSIRGYNFKNNTGTLFSISPSGQVGIGTSTPSSQLHVVGNSRDYKINKVILGSTENGAGINYILLHKIYEGTNLADCFVMGKITGIRGGTGSWNRKFTAEVNTSSAYQSNRGSVISFNETTRLMTVTYQGFQYLALEIQNLSALYYFSFTGYSQNEELRLVYDQDITNPQVFTLTDPVAIDGKFIAGGTLFEKLSTLPAEGAIPEGTWGTYFIGENSGIRGLRLGVSNDFYTKAELYFDNSNRADGTIAFKTGNTNSASQTRLFIKGDGNVGIGTVNPNQKLTVNGTIYGKEVKVDLSVPGPDYVFEPDYNLPSLTEIESYIKANKHLPEVPSAKEMEANGINLSEMNMLLLKKVEELTLHLIRIEKENEIQQKELNELKNRRKK